MVSVRVPATTANLGPGFDSFAMALGWYDQYSAEPARDWRIEVTGEAEGQIPEDENGRVAVAMQRLFDEVGESGRAAKVECQTRIPPGRGLGSSAAATVAGLMLADAMVENPISRSEILRLAYEIEGHADNVSAALFGGFTLAWLENGQPRSVRLDPATGLAAVVVVSDATYPTSEAREALPEKVPVEDAVFNVSRAALLAAGLALGRVDLARPGLADRLHEPYRAARVKDLDQVAAALKAAGCDGAVLSGAGPTVVGILLDTDDSSALERAVGAAAEAARLIKGMPDRREPVAVPIDRRGASII